MPTKKKLLLAEDDAGVRTALLKVLSELDIELIVATDGAMALERALADRPDLILLDVIMPKMHGIDMLNSLQADPRGKDVPVILLTNYSDDPKVVAAVKEKRCELMDKTKIKITDVVTTVQKRFGLT